MKDNFMAGFQFDPNDLQRLNRLVFLPKLTASGVQSGARRSRRGGDGNDFLDYRAYTAGDDVRKVDWNVFGRTKQLFVRLHESPRQLAVTLLIDSSISMRFGSGVTKLEQAQRIACALGFVAMRGGDRLYASSFADVTERGIGPLTGARGLSRLVRWLQTLDAGGQSNLQAAASSLRKARQDRGVILVLSDFLNVPGREEALQALQANGAKLLVVQVIDPIDRGVGLSGSLRLRDSESGRMVDVNLTERSIQKFQVGFEEAREHFAAFSSKQGRTYMLANTDDHYLKVVCDAIRSMASRG